MKLLAPTDTCKGHTREAGPQRGKAHQVCLRCSRLDPMATAQPGRVYAVQGVAQCDEILYSGSHAAQSERMTQTETSLHRGVDS